MVTLGLANGLLMTLSNADTRAAHHLASPRSKGPRTGQSRVEVCRGSERIARPGPASDPSHLSFRGGVRRHLEAIFGKSMRSNYYEKLHVFQFSFIFFRVPKKLVLQFYFPVTFLKPSCVFIEGFTPEVLKLN